MNDFSAHPLMGKFWRQTGTKCAANDSLTLDDYVYTLRLDDRHEIELREDRHCYYSSIISESRTFRGTWEAISVGSDRVVLRLIGIENGTAATEKFLVVTRKDILYTSQRSA